MIGTPEAGAVAENWRRNKRLVTAWDAGVKNAAVALVYGKLVFNTDNRKMYRHMDGLAAVPDGSAILDIPSGGGVLLRAVRPGRRLRYVAADISPLMLERVRAEAARRGLTDVEIREADAGALPFDDGTFDVVASYSGLHCVPDPPAALREMARVLRPGGRLRGSVVVRGAGAVPDRLIDLWCRVKALSVVVPEDTFRGWLRDASFEPRRVERSGAVLYFECDVRG